MEERNQYKKMMEEQLGKWKNKINVLKAKADQLEVPAKNDYSKEIDALNRKVKGAELQLKKLNDMDDHKWNKSKTATEKTMSKVKHSLDRLGQKLA